MELRQEHWDGLREQGCLIADFPDRKLAIFCDDSGQVVILSYEGGTTHVATMNPDEVPHAMNRLLIAGARASDLELDIDSAYMASVAIEKARGG